MTEDEQGPAWPEEVAAPTRSTLQPPGSRQSGGQAQNRTWWRWAGVPATSRSNARDCLRPKTNRALTGAAG